MTTILYTHPICIEHKAGPHHPENPERLIAVNAVLGTEEFAKLERREAPLGEREEAALAHPRAFVDVVLDNIPSEGYLSFDGDTIVSPASGEAALRGVGALTAAVDAVVAGEAKNAFCAVRPPGHHAEQTRAMGFCLFNNVAVAAHHARNAHDMRRVAVVDFDVHHGNGTQAIFWDEPDLFFGSTHQMPLYPGTGARDEQGGHGNIFNAPLDPGTGSGSFRRAMEERILPNLQAFGPELIIISAGFDAHQDDPLANLNLVEEDFAWATGEIMAVADEVAGGRVVSALEGGYDHDALARSVAAHVKTLMG